MSRLSQPLDLQSQIKPPTLSLDAVPFVDVLLLGLCMLLMGSTYVAAPGAAVEIPSSAYTEALPISSVLTIKHDKMLLYQGRIFSLVEFDHYFKRKNQANGRKDYGVLLMKLNRDVSMQTFLDVCDIAREAGFSRVQIAATTQAQESPLWMDQP